MNEIANKIKELRSRKGYSQEELAERSGLSPRTIQRIESGETEPRGDSLVRLAAALDVTVDELADGGLVEDRRTIIAMNLSALSFVLNPILGVVAPLMIWLLNKDRVKGLDETAYKLLNFQIIWVIVFYACTVVVGWVAASSASNMMQNLPTVIIGDDLDPVQMIRRKAVLLSVMKYLLWGYNILMILVNAIRAGSGNEVSYVPSIRFFGKREA